MGYKSFEKYAEAIRISPDFVGALNDWGIALWAYACTLEREEADRYFRESFEKFAEAVTIKPDFHPALYNWGVVALIYLSEDRDEVDSSFSVELAGLERANEAKDARACRLELTRIMERVAKSDTRLNDLYRGLKKKTQDPRQTDNTVE